jgi:H+/gluconate symporter-like permease
MIFSSYPKYLPGILGLGALAYLVYGFFMGGIITLAYSVYNFDLMKMKEKERQEKEEEAKKAKDEKTRSGTSQQK